MRDFGTPVEELPFCRRLTYYILCGVFSSQNRNAFFSSEEWYPHECANNVKMPFSSELSRKTSSRSTSQRTTRSSSANSGDSVLSPRQCVPSIIRQIRDPVCTDFGIDREKVYNEFHFCSECKAFELEKVADPKLTRERNLRKYACQAGHKSFDFPTVKQITGAGVNVM